MQRTFGTELRQFCRTSPSIDQHLFNHILKKVKRYVKSSLHIDTFELLIKCNINGKNGLRPQFGRELGFDAYEIRTVEGQPEGHCALCFHSRKPVWIVNPDQKALASADSFVDKWSKSIDIPPYKEFRSSENKTLIAVPMRRGDEILGVADFESTKHLLFSPRATIEFEQITAAMCKLHLLLLDSTEKHEALDRAIDNIDDELSSKDIFRLVKPTVFFASSVNADAEVVGAIEEVLNEFSHLIDTRSWYNFAESGNITRQIMKEIRQCSLGVCYLSEKAPGKDDRGFVDNPNVLFEAGMLQAFSRDPISEPKNWIPVREAPPPPTPFDFAAERIVQVSRSQNGALNKAKLRSELSKRITAALDT